MVAQSPLLSVIDSTTPTIPFGEQLAVYRKAGYDGIGITEPRLGDHRDDLELFRASGLRASSCFLTSGSILPGPPLQGPEDPTARLGELRRSMERIAPFEPKNCHVLSGPCGRYGASEARKIVVDGVRELAVAARGYGMTLGVELMHTSLHETFGFLHEIPDAIDLLDEVGEENAAIAVDVWHLSDDPDVLNQLRDHATRFSSVHVDDRRDPTRSWCDRVLPGDGTADLVGILESLADGGFDGWFELEVLSDNGSVENDFPDSLWKADPLQLVIDGRAKFLEAWNSRRDRSLEGAR